MKIRVCPTTFQGQVRQALSCLSAAFPWLSLLQAKTEDPIELFLLHPNRKPFCGHVGEPDPWGFTILPRYLSCSFCPGSGGVGSRFGLQCCSSIRRTPTRSKILPFTGSELMDSSSPWIHAFDHTRREILVNPPY